MNIITRRQWARLGAVVVSLLFYNYPLLAQSGGVIAEVAKCKSYFDKIASLSCSATVEAYDKSGSAYAKVAELEYRPPR